MFKKIARWLKIEKLKHELHLASRAYTAKPSLRTLADRCVAEGNLYRAKWGTAL